MADKTIGDLNNAPGTVDDSNTLFVVQQAGTAYKLDGHAFILALTSILDGHGGINSIVYTAPVAPSLDGTLTITLADTTQTSLTIKNGKGITSIAKTGTSGLVDTYTISYNDGTTGTFTVTNGAKGDTGDSWYVWIRYSGQQPTQDSDIGTTPDNWIGVYSGTSSTAPTHYTDYQWFQIKGAKGDTGDPATVDSSEIAYQGSASGTTVPTGEWSTTIPVVSQGQYLWTRTTVTFNIGNPVIWYSVSYIAVDGSGSPGTATPLVDSGSGAVGTAMSYARQDHQHPLNVASTGTPQMDGAASRGSESTYARSDHIHPTDTSRASAAELATYVRPNLLDNWYFVGGGSQQGGGQFPINQRGQTSYNANAYCIDRWMLGEDLTASLDVDGIHFARGSASEGKAVWQTLEKTRCPVGTTVTFSLFGTLTGVASMALYDANYTLLDAKTLTNEEHGKTLVSWTVSMPANSTELWRCFIYFISGTTSVLKAVKLEIGNTQTLAHQENGVWVLNEIPDYEIELIKCKTSTADPTDTFANDSVVYGSEIGIVINGNSTPVGASAGQYVIVKSSTISGITDGLYTAAQAIPANTAIDATYLTAVSGGGLNDILVYTPVTTLFDDTHRQIYYLTYPALKLLFVFAKSDGTAYTAGDYVEFHATLPSSIVPVIAGSVVTRKFGFVTVATTRDITFRLMKDQIWDQGYVVVPYL